LALGRQRSPLAEEEEVEAFRRASPSGSAGTQQGAPASRRHSALSGGPLAAALAEPSPGSEGARRSRGSRGSGGSDLFGPAPGADELPEEAAGGWAEGGGGGGLFRESDLGYETQKEASQRHPAASLSGVSAGVARYFAAAFGSDSQQPDAILAFPELVEANRLSRSQTAQLFAQARARGGGAALRLTRRRCSSWPPTATWPRRSARPTRPSRSAAAWWRCRRWMATQE